LLKEFQRRLDAGAGDEFSVAKASLRLPGGHAERVDDLCGTFKEWALKQASAISIINLSNGM
jgi:hypothetical protein